MYKCKTCKSRSYTLKTYYEYIMSLIFYLSIDKFLQYFFLINI